MHAHCLPQSTACAYLLFAQKLPTARRCMKVAFDCTTSTHQVKPFPKTFMVIYWSVSVKYLRVDLQTGSGANMRKPGIAPVALAMQSKEFT
jgi:hypothetical protein